MIVDKARLQELKRQRDLLQQHLDWLNQEIDRETLASAPEVSPKASRLAEALSDDKPVDLSLSDNVAPEIESASQELVASDLYSELGPDTKSAAADTKRGCLLIGGFAFCLLGALVTWVVFFYE